MHRDSIRSVSSLIALCIGLMWMDRLRADFIYYDSNVTLTVTDQPAPNTPSYTTFSIYLEPLNGYEIGSIEADFDAPPTVEYPNPIGQINAGNTLFHDDYVANGTGPTNELDDSHFAFNRNGTDMVVDLDVFDSDTTSGLHAYFGLSTAISSSTNIAHVVLQNGVLGNAVIDLAISDGNTVTEASFNIPFSSAGVPEPSSLVLLLAPAAVALVTHRRRRNRIGMACRRSRRRSF